MLPHHMETGSMLRREEQAELILETECEQEDVYSGLVFIQNHSCVKLKYILSVSSRGGIEKPAVTVFFTRVPTDMKNPFQI